MPTVAELLAALESIAPSHLAVPDDPIGLQLGRNSDVFEKGLVTLDATPDALEAAVSLGANVVVSHHPLIYTPIRSLAGDGVRTQTLRTAMKHSIAIIGAHTNWDAAEGGVNDTLAAMLGLRNVTGFGNDIPRKECKLATFVPLGSLDSVVDALSKAGAGRLGLYRRCAFYQQGLGTFEPLAGANPTIGEVGKRESVEEYRVEMRVPGFAKEEVISALRAAHPYEEPAFDIWEVEEAPFSLGRCGEFESAMQFGEMGAFVDRILRSNSRCYGKPSRKIRRLGIVGGSGGGYWMRAKSSGCDALLTGEVRHHEGVEAAESGFCLIESGHYHTEQPGVRTLCERLSSAMGDTAFSVFEPQAGNCGRPI